VLNACELQIDLFCSGLRIAPSVTLEGARGIVRTRAGHASGLELAIPTGSWVKRELWMNAPILEPFAARSPYELGGSHATGYTIRDERTGDVHAVRIPRQPNWYQRLTSRDVPMSRIGVLQGTHLAISLNPVCAFWNYEPALNCHFCSTGHGVTPGEQPQKTLEDVIETCWAAKEDSGVTFAHLTAGFQGSRGIAFAEPFVRAIKQDVGLLVGLQLAPERDLSRYDRLIDLGIDHLTFCIDLVDPEWFARICPGKARTLGQKVFFEALERCAAGMPRGAVSGQIIAGIEPIEHTLAGIERIVSAGAAPSVCIFRPTTSAAMADWPAPKYESMRQVMLTMYDACRRHRLPIGIAPNVEASLVVNPDDAALLAPRTAGFYAYELWRRALRVAARPVFASRQQAVARRVSVEPSAEIGAPPGD
jgi:hypothetical protein